VTAEALPRCNTGDDTLGQPANGHLTLSPSLDRLRKAIDPAFWAREELGFEPDPWQVDALRADDREVIFLCCRQSGKSTTAAIKAAHRAVCRPGSMIILISPTLRQSIELFDKVRTGVIAKLKDPPKLVEDNKTSLRLENGSRIVALPASPDTVVCYSAVDLLIKDESARCPPDIDEAVLPMLATTNGQYIQLSTPKGKRNKFYHDWIESKARKFKVIADDVPRITKAFLAKMKAKLGSRKYGQEFLCEFLEEQEGDQFKREWFADKYVLDHPPGARAVRFWDKAATEVRKNDKGKEENDPDWTAGVKMCEKDGQFWVIDVRRDRRSPKGNEDLIKDTAASDGYTVAVRMEEEGGSSGKDTSDRYQRSVLKGYNFKGIRSTGSKVERAEAFSAACEAGNVFIVRGKWDYNGFVDRLCSFPSVDVHDDEVDAAAGAFNELARTDRGYEPSEEDACGGSRIPDELMEDYDGIF
jgi:predicted phage terminase large subunit-like protein